MAQGLDAVLGCLVGGAIGDALGGVSERGDVSLSDDTQLTLATCESIVEAGRVEPGVLAATFVRWFQARRFRGLGAATVKALRDLEAGAHWALAGATGEMTAGNGGAMRIAPLAFVSDVDRTAIRDVVRITHHHDEAYLGALAVFLAMKSPLPPSPDVLIAQVAAQLPDCRVRDQLFRVGALRSDVDLGELAAVSGSSGWVVETVPLALSAAVRMAHRSFADTLDQLVRIGGDTDTIAAIAGQIAGAHLGLAGLPPDLVSLVPDRNMIEDIGQRFWHTIQG